MKFWQKSVKPVSALLGLALTLLVAHPVSARVVDRVVAKVNGEIITQSSVEERVAVAVQQLNASGNPSEFTEKDIIEKTLNAIIEEKLQLQEAKKSGLEVDDESVENAFKDIQKRNNITAEQMQAMLEQEGRSMEQYKEVIRDQILVTKVVQFHMGKSGSVTKKQIKKYYFENQKEFWQPRQPFVRHLLLIADESATPEQKRLKKIKANEILRQIRSGKDFNEMAKKHSEDVSASSGGEIGLLKKGHLVPEFEEVAFSLKPGEISDVVESRYGYHIIKVDSVIPGKAQPIDEVKDKIEQALQMQNRKDKYDEWMNELKKDAMIQITLFEEKNPKENTNQDLFLEKAQTPSERETHWEEASNVKNKSALKNVGLKGNNFKEIKNKLSFIKRLRKHEKISEEEYQARKQDLLDQL
ncbi:MAG: hypothetical protein NPINA01_11160 [Nitrospinaceae bacterium]|nr:MAG: hypothetical protein NPINA01_11160 [Nitrospinaceae bacterium]